MYVFLCIWVQNLNPVGKRMPALINEISENYLVIFGLDEDFPGKV